MRKTLVLDFDGTIANTWKPALGMLRERYGVSASINRIKDYNITSNPGFEGLSYSQIRPIFAEVLRRDAVELEDHTIPKRLARLRRYYKPFLCTNSPAEKEDISRFLRENGIEVGYIAKFQDSCAKARVRAGAIVDDNEEVVMACANAGMHAILYSQPWNEGLRRRRSHKNISIANGWYDVECILMERMGITMGQRGRLMHNER